MSHLLLTVRFLDARYHGQADGVGPFGGAGGKKAPRGVVHVRDDGKAAALGLVEAVDEVGVGEAVEVGQCRRQIGAQFHLADGFPGSAGLDGHAFQAGKGRMDDADRREGNSRVHREPPYLSGAKASQPTVMPKANAMAAMPRSGA